MTEEQIKQNALKAEKEHGNFNYQYQGEAFNKSYLAGAHSRDEEVDKLKRLYEEVLHKYYETECKLRNPWISVEKRLPEEGKLVFVRTVVGSYSVGQHIYPQWYITGIPSAHNLVSVTHWMPIPELKKEE